jgi:D-lactate dehydrogenase
VPLLPSTKHMIDAAAVARLKPGVMLINTSRGALIDTAAVVDGLKRGIIGYLGLDVYEEVRPRQWRHSYACRLICRCAGE